MDSLPHIPSPTREQQDMVMGTLPHPRASTPVHRTPSPVRKEKESLEIPSMIIIMPNSSATPPIVKEIPGDSTESLPVGVNSGC